MTQIHSLQALFSLGTSTGGRYAVPPGVALQLGHALPQLFALRANLQRGGSRTQIDGLQPCLDLAQRPVGPQSPAWVVPTAALPGCGGCAARAACPAPLPVADLLPLRHPDTASAGLACATTLCELFDVPVPPLLLAVLQGLQAGRVGALDLPHPGWEFSLKRDNKGLLPLLRVVDYPPEDTGRGQEVATARRQLAQTVLGPLLLARERVALADFLTLQVQACGPTLDVSIGLEMALDGSGSHRVQLYAHPDPSLPDVAVAAMLAALQWAGVAPDQLSLLQSWLREHPAALPVLVAWSPQPQHIQACKVYLVAPGDLDAPELGLSPAALQHWASLTAPWGLAVLQAAGDKVRGYKRDAPVLLHAQQAGAVVARFAAGLPEVASARLVQALDGRVFAVWPTWVSASATGATLYFVPR